MEPPDPSSSENFSRRYIAYQRMLRREDRGKVALVVEHLQARRETVGLSRGEQRTLSRAEDRLGGSEEDAGGT